MNAIIDSFEEAIQEVTSRLYEDKTLEAAVLKEEGPFQKI